MSVLFNIPQDVYNIICGEWLPFKYLGFLDTALTNKILRPYLERQWKSNSIDVKWTNTKYSIKALNWIYARNINLTKLVLRWEHFDKDYLCKVDYSRIEYLVLHRMHLSDTVVEVIQSCRNIKSFESDSFSFPNAICKVAPSIASNLTSLTLGSSDWRDKVQSALFFIGQHCRQLRLVNLPSHLAKSHEFTDPYDKELKAIFRNNPNLETIEVGACLAALQSIIDYCKVVKSVKFRHSEFVFQVMGELKQSAARLPNVPIICEVKDSHVKVCHSVTGNKRLLYIRFDQAYMENRFLSLNFTEVTDFICVDNSSVNNLLNDVLNHSLESIQTITLETSSMLYEAAMRKILCCPNLRILKMQQMSFESELFVKLLGNAQCLRLQELHVRLSSLTIDVIEFILTMLPNLVTCTFEGMMEDIFNSKQLRDFLIAWCKDKTKFTMYVGFPNKNFSTVKRYSIDIFGEMEGEQFTVLYYYY